MNFRQPRPVDVVSLQGAALLTLEGGRRKRDVRNNGFAIRVRTGCTRYMLAPSGLELELWLQELQKAVKTYSGDGLDDDTTAEVPEEIHNDSEEEYARGGSLLTRAALMMVLPMG